jgi:hypothetical protein
MWWALMQVWGWMQDRALGLGWALMWWLPRNVRIDLHVPLGWHLCHAMLLCCWLTSAASCWWRCLLHLVLQPLQAAVAMAAAAAAAAAALPP